MVTRKIAWQFFIVCFAIASVALWVTTWYSATVFDKLYMKTVKREVLSNAYMLNREFTSLINDSMHANAVDSLSKKLGPEIGMRITVVLPSGKVIGDSQSDPDSMENHSNRPEIIKAIEGETAMEQRFSATLKQDMLYTAIPVKQGSVIKAALRVAVSLKDIKNHERAFCVSVIITSLIIFILLVIASYLLSRRISKPIQIIEDGAKRFAEGQLDFKLTIPKAEELGGLAKSLNTMASSLDDRIRTITRQRNELNAILTSMSEGVIAVDSQENIISINPAASNLFGITNELVKGKWLHGVIRNSTLQRFCTHVLTSDTMVETTFTLHTPEGDKNINASGTVLSEGAKGAEGAVLVLNDITRLRKLENLRKDFVANVSHELRTPLTSIKGFVETIITGDYKFPEEVAEFLGIIATKTDRLCSIVDDILSLSSIERDFEHREVTFTDALVRDVIEDAVQTCKSKANSKNIAIAVDVDDTLNLKMNTSFIEQAIVNLIDNAIKYSDDGKKISIGVSKLDNEVVISVADEGIGIPPEHHERIFERFYRVDKARSRKLGGTGLGLSIVKNIAVVHGGRVEVESEPGKGSTFKIVLPANTENIRASYDKEGISSNNQV